MVISLYFTFTRVYSKYHGVSLIIFHFYYDVFNILKYILFSLRIMRIY